MSTWRHRLHEVIFEADTKAGKAFDILLIFFILLSISIIMLDSVQDLSKRYQIEFFRAEWFFTVLFTIEYFLRLISVKKARNYAFSFFGIVDFLSILPSYISLFFPGSHYLLTIRFLRVLRIFRVLKLVQFVSEGDILLRSLKRSAKKIIVFIMAVFILVSIFGSLMYIIEDAKDGFTSIPKSIYWAVVTLTTVGYGDITPQTNLGQAISALIMILGYGIIAVPTGIVTAEMTRSQGLHRNTQHCANCGEDEHDDGAKFCKSCGESLLI